MTDRDRRQLVDFERRAEALRWDRLLSGPPLLPAGPAPAIPKAAAERDMEEEAHRRALALGLAAAAGIARRSGIGADELVRGMTAFAPAAAEVARSMEAFRLSCIYMRVDRLGPWIGAAAMLGTLALAALAGMAAAW